MFIEKVEGVAKPHGTKLAAAAIAMLEEGISEHIKSSDCVFSVVLDEPLFAVALSYKGRTQSYWGSALLLEEKVTMETLGKRLALAVLADK